MKAAGADDFAVTEYQCSICCELLLDPVVGSCGHDFCKDCLTSWHNSRAASGVPSVECPLCRRPLVPPGQGYGVCVRLRETIEKLFPEQVAARKAAKDLQDCPVHDTCMSGVSLFDDSGGGDSDDPGGQSSMPEDSWPAGPAPPHTPSYPPVFPPNVPNASASFQGSVTAAASPSAMDSTAAAVAAVVAAAGGLSGDVDSHLDVLRQTSLQYQNLLHLVATYTSAPTPPPLAVASFLEEAKRSLALLHHQQQQQQQQQQVQHNAHHAGASSLPLPLTLHQAAIMGRALLHNVAAPAVAAGLSHGSLTGAAAAAAASAWLQPLQPPSLGSHGYSTSHGASMHAPMHAVPPPQVSSHAMQAAATLMTSAAATSTAAQQLGELITSLRGEGSSANMRQLASFAPALQSLQLLLAETHAINNALRAHHVRQHLLHQAHQQQQQHHHHAQHSHVQQQHMQTQQQQHMHRPQAPEGLVAYIQTASAAAAGALSAHSAPAAAYPGQTSYPWFPPPLAAGCSHGPLRHTPSQEAVMSPPLTPPGGSSTWQPARQPGSNSSSSSSITLPFIVPAAAAPDCGNSLSGRRRDGGATGEAAGSVSFSSTGGARAAATSHSTLEHSQAAWGGSSWAAVTAHAAASHEPFGRRQVGAVDSVEGVACGGCDERVRGTRA